MSVRDLLSVSLFLGIINSGLSFAVMIHTLWASMVSRRRLAELQKLSAALGSFSTAAIAEEVERQLRNRSAHEAGR